MYISHTDLSLSSNLELSMLVYFLYQGLYVFISTQRLKSFTKLNSEYNRRDYTLKHPLPKGRIGYKKQRKGILNYLDWEFCYFIIFLTEKYVCFTKLCQIKEMREPQTLFSHLRWQKFPVSNDIRYFNELLTFQYRLHLWAQEVQTSAAEIFFLPSP